MDYPPDKGIEQWLNSIAAEVINEQQAYITEQRLLNSRLIRALVNQKSQDLSASDDMVRVKKEIKDQLDIKHAERSKRSKYKEIFLVGIAILAFFLLLQFGALISQSNEESGAQPNQSAAQFLNRFPKVFICSIR